MRIPLSWFLFFAIFPITALNANGQQWTPIGDVSQVSRIPGGVEVKAGQASFRVTAIGDSVMRVRAARDGTFGADASWAVTGQTPGSTAPKITETPSAVDVEIPAGHVRIEKKPLRLIFLDTNGQIISEDDDRLPMSFSGDAFRVTRKMPEEEMYSGLGDKTTLNLRNHAFTMWNTDAFAWQESTDPLYKSIPFFIALRKGKAYGTFLDNTWRTYFDFGKASRDRYSFGADGGELNYYFFFGPDPKKVLTSFAELTGKPPLPPLWTLGYQQSRYSYYPEPTVRALAQMFRQKKIPADVIYLDIDYQEAYRPFTINRQYFPTFEKMIQDLRNDGFSTVVITDLHIAKVPGYKPYDEGLAADHFVKNPDGTTYVGRVWPGDSVFPDFTLSSARQWWGTLYKDFASIGIRGFWNDMNEPAIFDRDDKTMPLATEHRLDDGNRVDHRAVHNVFGMLNSRATYEGLLKLQLNERPFVLTRATYAGGQRYAATWTGDNSSTWNHLRMAVPTLLNLGISGSPLAGTDVGGFNGNPTPELLTRWTALAAFTPIFRNHAIKGSANREPWVDGPEHEQWRKELIEQRYRMLPYIYTLAEEASRTGLPMMRPLFLEFPQEEWLSGNQDEFLLGPYLLVAPKVWEMALSYDVRLPSGEWYDYWTGEKVTGGPAHARPAGTPASKPNELPVYVRAGAIIPHQPVIQHTQETPQGPLELRVFPGPNCFGSMYLDDGHTFNHQRGEFLREGFTCAQAGHSLTVQTGAAQGSYKPWFREVQFTVYGIASAPLKVIIDGAPVQNFHYDHAQGVVTAVAPHRLSGSKIEIQY
ncbi:MAG TPA: glycoside hydrolase family 31 protein [Candidatus Solibacter sp.]|jgi:alpha-glucosidase|nr:glycoside hydrolase family 31 protein [Candidatus Solibacter sp.]